MRATRKVEETHFARMFLIWFRGNIDPDASEVAGITDRPDMAIETHGKIVAVEFAQIPSSYIIQSFYRNMPEPSQVVGQITGSLVVHPFEPHRWVHEVVQSKERKADAYRRAANADGIWLVMHAHSVRHNWPNSDPSKSSSRNVEALLMRFGLKNSGNKFGRIFYAYADGSVVDLTDGAVPAAISLPSGAGYPAVTFHKFSFSFVVPLKGGIVNNYHFNKIVFQKKVITPKDTWMANAHPEIKEPTFTGRATVSSETAEWEVLRNGASIGRQKFDVTTHTGETMHLHLLLEWSIQKATFEVRY